ncbi:MAG: alpha/beta hydrolase, partial [Pseudomonas sp.]
MRRLLATALLLCLGGCSNLLFYPVQGLPFTPTVAKVAYRDINLTAADGTRLHAWWLPVKEGVALKGTVLH